MLRKMLSIVVSTFVFFVASWYIKCYLDGIDIPKGLTRSMVIFSAALLISYSMAVLVDWLVSVPQ